MSVEYEIREYACSVDVPRFAAMVTYKRSWRERWFTLPWRPFQRTGVRPSMITLMEQRMDRAEQAMRAELDQPMYGSHA